MDHQQIFDAVCEHLAAQKKRAVDYDGQCVYRSKSGTRCAVGALIPDDMYDTAMEAYGDNYKRITLNEARAAGVPEWLLLKNWNTLEDRFGEYQETTGGGIWRVLLGAYVGHHKVPEYFKDEKTAALLASLQGAHDGSNNWSPSNMRRALLTIAEDFDLDGSKAHKVADALRELVPA